MDDIFFGDKFSVYDFILSSTYEIESYPMKDALIYMKPFLMKNVMPTETKITRFITENGGEIIIDVMKDLYNYINDRDHFQHSRFNGFISLDYYEKITPIEQYINSEDGIIIFVYEQNINTINVKDKDRIYTFLLF